MPTSIDWPLKNPRRRRRRFFLILAVLAVVVLRRPHRVVVFCRPAVVPVARLRKRLYRDPGSRVEHLRGFCSGHVSHPLRIVCRSEAGPSARFAQQPHDLLRRTAGKAAGRTCHAPHRVRRIDRHCPGDGRRHDGGVADARPLLVCAARHGRRRWTRSLASR